MAAATELLDPVFLKALQLLHSRHPDSLEQLKALRDEAFRQHTQPETSNTQEKTKEIKSSMQERRPSVITSSYSLHRPKEPKSTTIQTIEVGSSTIEPVKDLNTDGATIEDMGLFVETIEEFGSLLEQPSSKKARVQISVENVLNDDVLKSPEVIPVEDLTIDLGITCGVCSGSESKQIGNKLVECHECHSHFHQKCHEPRISDQDANDLRLVWYCNQCNMRMREMAKHSAPKAKNIDTSSRSSFTAAMKPVKLQSFQRVSTSDSKPPFSPTTTPQSFAIPGLAAAAASCAVSNKQSLPTSTTSTQKSSMQTAMKRLQMVKKKAAQKNLNHQQMKLLRR